jgi:hypothetical protein
MAKKIKLTTGLANYFIQVDKTVMLDTNKVDIEWIIIKTKKGIIKIYDNTLYSGGLGQIKIKHDGMDKILFREETYLQLEVLLNNELGEYIGILDIIQNIEIKVITKRNTELIIKGGRKTVLETKKILKQILNIPSQKYITQKMYNP